MGKLSGRWIPRVLLFPSMLYSAWCRDLARPSSTFSSCCSGTSQRPAKVNAANMFWYPDYSENMDNTNQIKRKRFKIALNNLDAYKRLKIRAPIFENWVPRLPFQIGGTLSILKRSQMLVLLTLPLSAPRQFFAWLCLCPGIQASLGRATGCAWVLGFPTLPGWVKGWNPICNQSCWHLHKPGPWPESCTSFHCLYSCENWDVGNPLSKLLSAATHGKSPGGHQAAVLQATADPAS